MWLLKPVILFSMIRKAAKHRLTVNEICFQGIRLNFVWLLRLIFLKAVYEVDEAKWGWMRSKEVKEGWKKAKGVQSFCEGGWWFKNLEISSEKNS